MRKGMQAISLHSLKYTRCRLAFSFLFLSSRKLGNCIRAALRNWVKPNLRHSIEKREREKANTMTKRVF